MSFKNCARCGHGNEAAADFCEQCGLRLGAGWRAAVAPRAAAPAGVIPFDFPARPLRTASDVLGPTFRLYREHYVTVGKIVLAAALPQVALEYAVGLVAVSPWEPTAFSWAAQIATGSLMTGALVYAVMSLLRTGAAPPLAASYGWGARKWWRVVLCSILLSVMTWAGFLFLVIPGVILMAVFAVALPAVVAEDLGPVAALERSARLTKGYRDHIFATIFVMLVTVFAAVWLTTGFSPPPFRADSPFLVTLVHAAVSQMIYSALTVLSIFTYLGVRADRGEGPAAAAPAARP